MATAALSSLTCGLRTVTHVLAHNNIFLPAVSPACRGAVSKCSPPLVVAGPTGQNAGSAASFGASQRKGSSRRASAVRRRLHAASQLLDQEVPEGDVSPQLTARLCRFIRSSSSVDEALEILAKMRAADISPTADAYAAVISVCRRCRDADRALEVYQSMQEQGVVPDTSTLNELLMSLGQCQNVSAALRLKDEMAASGITPDVVTYTSVMAILSYSRTLNDQEILRRIACLFDEMAAADIAPDTFCYNTVIRAAARARQMDQALAYYEAMLAAGTPPKDAGTRVDPSNKGVRIAAGTPSGTASRSKVGGSPRVAPNQFTYDILIEGACVAHRVPVAMELFSEMKARRVRPGPVAYNRVITSHLQGPVGTTSRVDLEFAFAVFEEMLADKVAPRAGTVDALVAELLAVAPPLPTAVIAVRLESLFGATELYDLALTPATYERLIQFHTSHDAAGAERAKGDAIMPAFGPASISQLDVSQLDGDGDGRKHFAVFRAMRRAGVAATPAAMLLLAEACARDGYADGATELLSELERLGGGGAGSHVRSNVLRSQGQGMAGKASGGVSKAQVASKAVYHSLMTAFGRAGQWEGSLTACNRMRADASLSRFEREPDASTYEALFTACLGENGLSSAMSPLGRDGRSLLTCPALAAAVELYREAVAAHVLPSPSTLDMGPHVVDLRGLSRAACVIAMVTALEACAAAPSPVGDLKFVLSIAGAGRANMAAEDVGVTASVLESVAANGLGLAVRRELAGNMAGVTVDSAQLREWLQAPPFVVAERVFSTRA
eukprot:jgi/Mesvir1/4805/Mv11099-RA.1